MQGKALTNIPDVMARGNRGALCARSMEQQARNRGNRVSTLEAVRAWRRRMVAEASSWWRLRAACEREEEGRFDARRKRNGCSFTSGTGRAESSVRGQGSIVTQLRNATQHGADGGCSWNVCGEKVVIASGEGLHGRFPPSTMELGGGQQLSK